MTYFSFQSSNKNNQWCDMLQFLHKLHHGPAVSVGGECQGGSAEGICWIQHAVQVIGRGHCQQTRGLEQAAARTGHLHTNEVTFTT